MGWIKFDIDSVDVGVDTLVCNFIVSKGRVFLSKEEPKVARGRELLDLNMERATAWSRGDGIVSPLVRLGLGLAIGSEEDIVLEGCDGILTSFSTIAWVADAVALAIALPTVVAILRTS